MSSSSSSMPISAAVVASLALGGFAAATASSSTAPSLSPSGPAPSLSRSGLDAARCSSNASNPEWAALCGWAIDCGMRDAAPLYLGHFARGDVEIRGLGVADDVEMGETFGCLPLKCIFHQEMPEVKTFWKGATFDEDEGSTEVTCSARMVGLAIFMAEEDRRGRASPWAALFASLPSLHDYGQFHPAFWPSDLAEPAAIREPWTSDRKVLDHCLAEAQASGIATGVSLADVFLQYIRLRSYGTEVFLFGRYWALIDPVTNLVNGAPARLLNVDWVEVHQPYFTGMCLRATRDLEAGEELLIEYDAKLRDPLYFFMHFGFAFGPEEHRRNKKLDCRGLRPHELREPSEDAPPIVRNLWRFASVHCRSGRRRRAADRAAPQEL